MTEPYAGQHRLEDCQCDHAPTDHDLMPTQHRPGGELNRQITCHRCEHIAVVRNQSAEEIRQYAGIISGQGERFIAKFPDLDLAGVENFDHEGEPLAKPANMYERMATAERLADTIEWLSATVDGRTAKGLMDRLWDVVTELRRRQRTTPE